MLGKALGSRVLELGDNSIIIGRDGRNSSPDMYQWLSQGILSTGCNVINIGILPTPILYFSVYKFNLKNGVMITGSHNPAEYNGFKIVINNKTLSGESIQEIKRKVETKMFIEGKGKEDEENARFRMHYTWPHRLARATGGPLNRTTAAGFEPARAEPIGFQVQLLNHSDTLSHRFSTKKNQSCASIG